MTMVVEAPWLIALFPRGTAAFEASGPADPASLRPEEAAAVERAVPKRIGEFAAGRACARRALAQLGFGDVALPVGSDRRPLWPAGAVGSISHTEGLCVAVAAGERSLSAIGVDVERIGRLEPRLWATICTAEERAWLERQPRSERTLLATLLFSAKEAFFKCQFGWTGLFLGFQEVAVKVYADSYSVRTTRSGPGPDLNDVQGRYIVRGDFVAAGNYVESQGSGQVAGIWTGR